MQHHPLPEYPRPALRRDSYENLNGLWQYAITGSAGLPAKWDGDILVPYSPETKASGVERTLQPGAWLHYHRSFVLPAGTGGRVLLTSGPWTMPVPCRSTAIWWGPPGRLLALCAGYHRCAEPCRP